MRRTNYPAWLLFAVVVVLAVLLFRANKSQNEKNYSSSAIMEKISYVKELSLVRYNYNGVISYKDYMKFMNLQVPLTEKSFLIRYNGYVKAGIDMQKASVDVSGKSIKVHLPKPEIQETVIDEKAIQVYDESMNILNPVSVEDYKKAIVGEKNKISQEAVKQGILTESSDQAHKFITSVLTDLGFEKIDIDEITPITFSGKELKGN